jgi:hypothetical protein
MKTELKVNSWVGKVGGRGHDYSYYQQAVPVSALKRGENEVSYFADTVDGEGNQHHCLEILWPGPAIAVQYQIP